MAGMYCYGVVSYIVIYTKKLNVHSYASSTTTNPYFKPEDDGSGFERFVVLCLILINFAGVVINASVVIYLIRELCRKPN